jgi:hypothetical protein
VPRHYQRERGRRQSTSRPDGGARTLIREWLLVVENDQDMARLAGVVGGMLDERSWARTPPRPLNIS